MMCYIGDRLGGTEGGVGEFTCFTTEQDNHIVINKEKSGRSSLWQTVCNGM